MDAFIKQLQQLMAAHGIRVLAMTALDPHTHQPRSVNTAGAEQVLRKAVAAKFGLNENGAAETLELRTKVAALEAELKPLRAMQEAQGETGWEQG